jgi:hypothetical protein
MAGSGSRVTIEGGQQRVSQRQRRLRLQLQRPQQEQMMARA